MAKPLTLFDAPHVPEPATATTDDTSVKKASWWLIALAVVLTVGLIALAIVEHLSIGFVD